MLDGGRGGGYSGHRIYQMVKPNEAYSDSMGSRGDGTSDSAKSHDDAAIELAGIWGSLDDSWRGAAAEGAKGELKVLQETSAEAASSNLKPASDSMNYQGSTHSWARNTLEPMPETPKQANLFERVFTPSTQRQYNEEWSAKNSYNIDVYNGYSDTTTSNADNLGKEFPKVADSSWTELEGPKPKGEIGGVNDPGDYRGSGKTSSSSFNGSDSNSSSTTDNGGSNDRGTRLPDGSTRLPDGTIVHPDGSKTLPNGTKVLPDGTRVLPDGTRVHPDGSRTLPNGTRILPDGTKILPDGTRIRPDGTKILPDGTIVRPNGQIVPPGNTSSSGLSGSSGSDAASAGLLAGGAAGAGAGAFGPGGGAGAAAGAAGGFGPGGGAGGGMGAGKGMGAMSPGAGAGGMGKGMGAMGAGKGMGGMMGGGGGGRGAGGQGGDEEEHKDQYFIRQELDPGLHVEYDEFGEKLIDDSTGLTVVPPVIGE